MNATFQLMLVGPLPPPSGGMANQTRQLMRLLEGEGVQVTLVQTNAPYWPAWVAAVPGLRAVFRLVPYLGRLWRAAGRTDVAHVMANSGWAWHLFAAPAIHIARWRGRPVIVNYRGGLAPEFLQRAGRRVRRTLRDARVVVPSEFLREVFAQHGVAASIIPNIVDTTVFVPAVKVYGGRASLAPHIVIARNLEHIYGVDVGLRALAILRRATPGLRASITGTGPELPRLQALAAELGLVDCVRFTGRLDVPAMVALYQDADLVLNPVRADNAPNSVLEALACGVPVVSTRVGGVPYLVEHGRTAWLVEPESPEALAAGVEAVFADAALRAGLVARGIERARECAWPAVKDQWLRAYGAMQG